MDDPTRQQQLVTQWRVRHGRTVPGGVTWDEWQDGSVEVGELRLERNRLREQVRQQHDDYALASRVHLRALREIDALDEEIRLLKDPNAEGHDDAPREHGLKASPRPEPYPALPKSCPFCPAGIRDVQMSGQLVRYECGRQSWVTVTDQLAISRDLPTCPGKDGSLASALSGSDPVMVACEDPECHDCPCIEVVVPLPEERFSERYTCTVHWRGDPPDDPCAPGARPCNPPPAHEGRLGATEHTFVPESTGGRERRAQTADPAGERVVVHTRPHGVPEPSGRMAVPPGAAPAEQRDAGPRDPRPEGSGVHGMGDT